VRDVPDTYARCLRRDPVPLDPARARAQVQAYARVLGELGVAVERLPADEACPDCCFVEDAAVVLSAGLAVLTRPGAPSRRPELPPVERALRGLVAEVAPLDDPAATLDGGDVLRAGATLFVGLSERTNRAGADALGRVAARAGLSVVAVPVGAGLHLKSAVTLLAPGRLVLQAGALDPTPFLRAGLSCLEVEEPAGANVLALGPVVLVSSAAPRALARLVREPGLVVRAIDVAELHKGDGALTCLSLRVPPPGAWCA
jgi:dimethylargininase